MTELYITEVTHKIVCILLTLEAIKHTNKNKNSSVGLNRNLFDICSLNAIKRKEMTH